MDIVAITLAEKDLLMKVFPDLEFVRTCRQKSKRHNYYITERRDVMRVLRRLRTDSIVEQH